VQHRIQWEADRGCAFCQREPGADDHLPQPRPARFSPSEKRAAIDAFSASERRFGCYGTSVIDRVRLNSKRLAEASRCLGM